jgi:hypothetical protein
MKMRPEGRNRSAAAGLFGVSLAPLTGWKAIAIPPVRYSTAPNQHLRRLGRGGYCMTIAFMQYPG